MLKIQYGWEANSAGSILKLAFRIILVDLDMIDDVRYLVKVDSTQRFAINSYSITTSLKQNRIEKCFEFMNLLTDAECEEVLGFIVNIQDDSLSNNEFIHEFYKYCSQRVNDKTLLKIALSRQKLRSTFHFQLTPADLNYPDIRSSFFTTGIKTLTKNLASKESNLLDSCFKDVSLLCNSLNFDPMKGIVELTKTLDNILFTCGMAKTVIHVTTVNEHNYNYFVDLAVVLIGQQIKSFDADIIHASEDYSYLLASKLLQQSLKHGQVYYREISQLISWCLIGRDIYSVNESENFLKSKADFERNMLQDTLNESCNGSSDSFSVFESVRFANTLNSTRIAAKLKYLRLIPRKRKMVGKRRNPIGQIENDTWLAFHPSSGVPPPISKYRIPFLLTVNKTLEDILRDELNVEDFDKWYQLIEIHAQMAAEDTAKIPEIKDNLCMLDVKNSVGENQNKFKDDSFNYNFHPKNNEFLQSILRVTNKMNDKGNILSALHFTTKFASEGADQVEAAYECYVFAVNKEPELRKNRRDASILSQIKRLYPIYKLKFLLRLYNLMDDKLNELVEKPEDLICELYEHESILKEQQININKLVEEVADLHNKNLREIQMNILRKWFCDTVKNHISADETFCEQIDTISDVDPQNFEIITRTCYILSRWTPAEALHFCLRYLDQSSAAKKLLAFECYMKLSNEESEIFPCGQFIQIKCAYYLKQLGFKYNDQAFNNLPKKLKC